MDRALVVGVTLVAYKLLLIGIGFWAQSRTKDEEDFFLAGRGLGPLVAAISYSSSASSAWTLLGMSGLAFVLGLSTIWIVAGSIIGMLVAWFWIAPRLMSHSREHDQITLPEFLAAQSDGAMRRKIVVSASLIIIFCFIFYVAAQFQGAGNTFASTFGLSMTSSIVIGALIIMIYTLLGGFWAVSVTDTVQGLLMAFAALIMPLAALAEVGGFGGFWQGLQSVSTPAQLSWTGGAAGLVALGVVIGGLCIGFGTYGQPHLLVRFMALRDEKALRQARWITIAWFLVVFLGMYFLGLVGHVLHQSFENPEAIFFALTDSLFPSVIGAVLTAAVLSAIMSTADSQLLVAASAIAHDLGQGRRHPKTIMMISRLTIVALVFVAVLVALYLPETIFNRVLFAWIALGSAFGPTVFMRLAGADLKPGGVLLSILLGFSTAVLFYLLPSTPGDIAERILPFTIGLTVLFLARESRSAGL
jgi:sodium/proline symporter